MWKWPANNYNFNNNSLLQPLDNVPCNFIGNKCITWYEIQGPIQEYFCGEGSKMDSIFNPDWFSTLVVSQP